MQKIGIFSKFDMAGGSEFRCVEFANGFVRYTDNETFILSEKQVPDRLKKYLDPKVKIVEDAFGSPKYFYDLDSLIVVNTDSKDFSTRDYWLGKSPRHNISIDIAKMKGKKIFFLYNFIISPSRHLSDLMDEGWDLGVLTTNSNFFSEVTKQDRYEKIRILPRYIMESPIDPGRLIIRERVADGNKPIVFGMHSKRVGSKWNNEFPELIKSLNERYGEDRIQFRFMGIKAELSIKMASFSNVRCLKEDEEPVSDFINSLDVFLFFPDWNREEPWARVIAEGMVSGCPVIALDRGGTKDQVLQENNGFLCKKFNDYYNKIVYFMEHPDMISKMSRNSIRISKQFFTMEVVKKLNRILGE